MNDPLHIDPERDLDFTLPWRTNWPAILTTPLLDVPYVDVPKLIIDFRQEDWRDQVLAAYDAMIDAQRRYFAAWLDRCTVETAGGGVLLSAPV